MKRIYENYYEDMKRALSVYESRWAGKNEKHAALRIAIWNVIYLLQPGKIFRRKSLSDSGKCRIAFCPRGGFGDCLIFANWLSYFLKKYEDKKFETCIFYESESIKSIFNYRIPKVSLHDRKKEKFSYGEYILIIEFDRYPHLIYRNENRIAVKESWLKEFVEACDKFYADNKLVFDHKPYLDGFASAKSVAKGIKRIQEGSLDGFFDISEDYKYRLKIEINEDEYLKSIGLEHAKFITVHRGWDQAYRKEHVKGWSLKSCNDVIEKIKIRFPDYRVVVFGASRAQAPDTSWADVDLVGNTTLEQVKVLLKRAAIHIDNEGGMVHLRHALHGGLSVVLFGPTSVDLFGYSENINLKSDACNMWCEWMSDDWQYRCVRRKKGHPCMEAITSEQIIKSLEERIKG